MYGLTHEQVRPGVSLREILETHLANGEKSEFNVDKYIKIVISQTAQTHVLADGRTIGKASAPVTMEVWSDFQCPVCGEFARIVEPQLIARYVTPGTLRIVHHDAAFQGAKSSASYDESVEAGAGARCAADQGRYWPFQDWTFANQSGENKGAFAEGRLRSIATAAGLDVTAWDACRATGEQQAGVRSDTLQALAAGVNATPTMILGGQTIVGLRTVTELGQMIEAAAAAAAAAASAANSAAGG